MSKTILSASTMFLLCSVTAAASVDNDSPSDTINIAYANILGSGIYTIGDRTAYVLNVPLEFVLYEPENTNWSLNLLLPVTVGVLDFDWIGFRGSDQDGDRLQTLGATPGVEADIQLSDHWTLKPFVQVGYVYDINDDYDAWIYMAGIRGLARYQVGEYDIGLGAAVRTAEQRPVSGGDNAGIGVIDLGVDARRTLGMQLWGEPLEVSIYAIASRYFNELKLLGVGDDAFEVEQTYEIGMTLGTSKPFRLLGIDWQRVAMGYMWGDGIESITFGLGFPF